MATNILFFLTDQHRIDTLGCYGGDDVDTPVLDAVAAGGTVFERCYTPTAICTPARASLLTGAAPFRHQLIANHERSVGHHDELADDQFTLGAALREAGYQVGLTGKWHVGRSRTQNDYGFDGTPMSGWHNPVDHPAYLAYLAEHDLPPYRLSDEIRGTFPNGSPGNLLAARLDQPVEATFEYFLAEQSIATLRTYAAEHASSGRPFFLATHFFGPHLPYNIPDAYFDRFDPEAVELPRSVAETFADKPPVQANYSAHWTFDSLSSETSKKLIAVYRGYVSLIDEQIGRIVAAADELGVYDDAAVFFSSDHGEFTGAHRLHDKGPAAYEDIYRIPGIVRIPGGQPGRHDERLVTLVDLTATVLELADLDPAEAVDGTSVAPLVRGEERPWREDLVLEYHGHHFPYPQRMLVTDRYKLVINPESVNELYDLGTDPDELHNRYRHPEMTAIRDELVSRLYRQLRARGDGFYHWMASMYPVGDKDFDVSLSPFDPV